MAITPEEMRLLFAQQKEEIRSTMDEKIDAIRNQFDLHLTNTVNQTSAELHNIISQTDDKIIALGTEVKEAFGEHLEMIRRLEERLDAIHDAQEDESLDSQASSKDEEIHNGVDVAQFEQARMEDEAKYADLLERIAKLENQAPAEPQPAPRTGGNPAADYSTEMRDYARDNPMVTVQRGSLSPNVRPTGFSPGLPGFDDTSLSPDQRRDNEKRRYSIFGARGSLPYQPSGFGSPQVVTAVQMVTRETFPDIELKNLTNLEHICIFFDKFENKQTTHHTSNLRMIEFCNWIIHGELVITAKNLGYIDSDIFGGSIMTLSDEQVKHCITEVVKARTADDFILKIKQVKFHLLDKDEYFAPNALSFPKLLKAAYLFNHNFIKILKVISLRADPKVIPPIYKEGKTTGLVDYYLACWPNDSGNNLYARVCVSEPSLRVHTCIEDFIYAFTRTIESYAKVKQDYDDLNSVLKCRPGEAPSKPHYPHGHSKDRGRNFHTPKKEHLHYHEDSFGSIEDEEDFEDSILNFTVREDAQHEADANPDPGEDLADEENLLALAVNRRTGSSNPNASKLRPCFWKFKYGKCTSPGCSMDHSEGAMAEMCVTRMTELVRSPFGPKRSEVLNIFDKIANQEQPANRSAPYSRPKA